MSTARELILLIGNLAASATPEHLADRAGTEFTTAFGAAALDHNLPAEEWDGIKKSYTGGFHHGYAAAIADLTLAAVVGQAVEKP